VTESSFIWFGLYWGVSALHTLLILYQYFSSIYNHIRRFTYYYKNEIQKAMEQEEQEENEDEEDEMDVSIDLMLNVTIDDLQDEEEVEEEESEEDQEGEEDGEEDEQDEEVREDEGSIDSLDLYLVSTSDEEE
jgi:hypothetical protein